MITLKIKKITTSPYHPESNHAFQRTHSSIKEYLKLLIRLYRILIRSRLDYGASFYNSDTINLLNSLDSIHHTRIQLAIGALRTSPKLSICIEAVEPSLQFRRAILIANFLVSFSPYETSQ